MDEPPECLDDLYPVGAVPEAHLAFWQYFAYYVVTMQTDLHMEVSACDFDGGVCQAKIATVGAGAWVASE